MAVQGEDLAVHEDEIGLAAAPAAEGESPADARPRGYESAGE